MALADEALALASRQGGRCSVGRLLASLPESDRNEYEEAFADELLQSKALAKAIQARGYDIAEHAVRRHRGQGCKCPR